MNRKLIAVGAAAALVLGGSVFSATAVLADTPPSDTTQQEVASSQDTTAEAGALTGRASQPTPTSQSKTATPSFETTRTTDKLDAPSTESSDASSQPTEPSESGSSPSTTTETEVSTSSPDTSVVSTPRPASSPDIPKTPVEHLTKTVSVSPEPYSYSGVCSKPGDPKGQGGYVLPAIENVTFNVIPSGTDDWGVHLQAVADEGYVIDGISEWWFAWSNRYYQSTSDALECYVAPAVATPSATVTPTTQPAVAVPSPTPIVVSAVPTQELADTGSNQYDDFRAIGLIAGLFLLIGLVAVVIIGWRSREPKDPKE